MVDERMKSGSATWHIDLLVMRGTKKGNADCVSLRNGSLDDPSWRRACLRQLGAPLHRAKIPLWRSSLSSLRSLRSRLPRRRQPPGSPGVARPADTFPGVPLPHPYDQCCNRAHQGCCPRAIRARFVHNRVLMPDGDSRCDGPSPTRAAISRGRRSRASRMHPCRDVGRARFEPSGIEQPQRNLT